MVTMNERATLVAENPAAESRRQFTAARQDLTTLFFLSMASAPGGAWIMDYPWLVEGERFPADAAGRLGDQMSESLRSGGLARSLSAHKTPFADPRTESARMTGLFRDFADFVRHSGGFEVRDDNPGENCETEQTPA